MRIRATIMTLLLVPCFAVANLQFEQGSRNLTVFYTMTDRVGWKAILKGKIMSYSAVDELRESDLSRRAEEKGKATVRLYGGEGVHEGDTLYVINDSNLIVAKMVVKYIFNATSFGGMFVGYGNFRLSSSGDRVVQRAGEEGSPESYRHKARGDYYEAIGDGGEAIREYKTALKLDPNNPEAHLALGMIYKKGGLDQFAFKEFQESHRYIGRIFDNEDRFQLLKNMAEIRYKQVYEDFLPEKLRGRYRDEGMNFCRQALLIYPESERVNYYLGMFLCRWGEPDDKQAKEYFLRVITINPANSDALVALSKLYYRHESPDKARRYAEKALETDPRSTAARKWMKHLESREQVK